MIIKQIKFYIANLNKEVAETAEKVLFLEKNNTK